MKTSRRIPSQTRSQLPNARGFSLLELMIAMALGLLVTAALLAVYVRASQSNMEMERANRQMENGRYAVQLLKEELWHAGFWGELMLSTNPTLGGLVDHCTKWSLWTAQNKADVFYLPIQGYDNSGPSCSTNRQSGTDALVVRHASTCVAGASGCEEYDHEKLYLQVSRCATQTPIHVLGMEHSGTVFDKQRMDCSVTNLADKRKYISHLYYIRSYANKIGDGIPTLVRSEFDKDDDDDIAHQSAQALVEGIENLQIEYARDTNGDGEPDTAYVTTLTTAAEWSQVVAIKISVLARNVEPTAGYSDDKTYKLGSTVISAPGDGYKRHVFSTVVKLNNPAGRK